MNKPHQHTVDGSWLAFPKSMVHNSSSTKFKSWKDSSMLLEVRKVVLGKRYVVIGRVVRETSGISEMVYFLS